MNPLQSNWVDEIFKRFHGRFGNRFFAEYSLGKIGADGQDEGVVNAKRVWGEELAGFTPQEIKRGLSAQYPFMPDCDKFKLACRPSVDDEQSFYVSVEQMRLRKEAKDKWPNAVIYWAAVALGNDLNNYPYQSIKGRWKQALCKAKERIESGELPNEIPVKLVAIPSPGKTTVSKEESERRFAEIRAVLSKKIVNGESDNE